MSIQLGVLLVDCHTVGNPVFGADADGGALLIVIIADVGQGEGGFAVGTLGFDGVEETGLVEHKGCLLEDEPLFQFDVNLIGGGVGLDELAVDLLGFASHALQVFSKDVVNLKSSLARSIKGLGKSHLAVHFGNCTLEVFLHRIRFDNGNFLLLLFGFFPGVLRCGGQGHCHDDTHQYTFLHLSRYLL